MLKKVLQKLGVATGAQGKPSAGRYGRISSQEWNTVLLGNDPIDEILGRLRKGELSEWARYIRKATESFATVLELGSGTGEISLQLALSGRSVTLLDLSAESLGFAKRCAAALDVEISAVQGDVLKPLPFADNSFDCSWSSGLLEHFDPDERRFMLREQGRVTRGAVLVLVPNAACLAYRAGKEYQERAGLWRYGVEHPLLSLREDFSAAGIEVISETSVGAHHALEFLPADHHLRKSLEKWMRGKSEDELRECGQGYLLATIGKKR